MVVISRQARLSLVGGEGQGSAGPAEGATSNNGATYDTWYSSPGHGEVMGAQRSCRMFLHPPEGCAADSVCSRSEAGR